MQEDTERVVTSTLSAETTSLNTTLDQLSWLRLFWRWIRDPKTNWKNSTETLKKLPETFATSTFKEDPAIAITDCRSLYELVTLTAPPQCQEYRTQLQARAIRDLLVEGVTLRWVHSGAQLADALTKIMESHFLRYALQHRHYSLHDEGEILKQRASMRTRVKWLQTCAEESTANDTYNFETSFGGVKPQRIPVFVHVPLQVLQTW